MTDQSKTYNQTTLKDTPSAISSQGSVDGHTPCNSQDGQQIDLFGQDHAPVSRSVLLEDKKVKPTSVTYGPSGTASSESVVLQQSLENKLQTQLPTDSWMKSRMTWKEKVTPSERQYCQLAVSSRHTKGIDCGLWPTPKKQNANAPGIHGNGGQDLQTGALWCTPTAMDYSRGNKPPRPWDTGIPLSQQVTMWPTPCSQDGPNGGPSQGMTRLPGAAFHGKPALTENKGQLCPEFVCWLMGFPNVWLACMVSAMQLYRKSRRSSSKRIKT